MNRLLIALLLALVSAPIGGHAGPSPVPSASATPSSDVDVKIMVFFVNGKPVGVSPIVRKDGFPLCPVRLAELMKFKVDYVQNAKIATLTKASGETAVFKVGVKVAVVKTRAGQQRLVQMPVAPMILTPKMQKATDHMWIPLDTVVNLAGGKMSVEGRRSVKITL